jgi:anti-anti-sigma factor
MRITSAKKGNILILKPIGRLDGDNSPAVEERFAKEIDGGENRLILDLSEVTFMSSQGLRVILTAAKRAEIAEGKLVVCAAQPAVENTLNITGVRQLIKVCPAYPEAVAAFGG